MPGGEETHALFGGRTAYEAKHLIKNQVESAQRGETPPESIHDVHNKLITEAARKASELRVMTAGLTERLSALGGTWDQLAGASGDELNGRIHGYIEEWAEIDRVFQNLEAERQGKRERVDTPLPRIAKPEAARQGERGEGETQKTLRSFTEFVSKHQDLIARELKQGKKLDDILYDNFYTEDIDNRLYKEGNPAYERMRTMYTQEAKRVLDTFSQIAKKYEQEAVPPISPGEKSIKNGWVYFKLNGGANPSGKMGRLYLNIRPEQLVRFYEQALPMLQKSNLKADAKIAQTANPNDVNRYDKMVIYFNAEDEAGMAVAMEQLYNQNSQIFVDGSPKFTTPLVDSRGQSMVGVNFGEEPKADQGGKSFGDIRAKILAEVYTAAATERFSLQDARAHKAFEIACQKYGVDSKNAAFNAAPPNEQAFTLLKNRAAK